MFYSGHRKEFDDCKSERRNQILSPLDYTIGILTVPRNETTNYLYIMLSTLGIAFPSQYLRSVHLYAGSNDTTYLKYLKYSSRFNIHDVDVDAGMLSQLPIKTRASWNYARSLRSMITLEPNKSAYLLLEDDVILREGGHEFLEAAYREVVSLQRPAPWIIDCYVVTFQWNRTIDGKTVFNNLTHLADFTCCTQCLLFSPEAAAIVSSIIDKSIWSFMTNPSSFFEPYDMVIDNHQKTPSLEVWSMHNPIAQHIGKSSTGLAGINFHQGRWEVKFDA